MTRGKKTTLILAVVILAAVVGCAVYVNDYYATD